MSEGMSLLVECLGGHLCTTNVAVVPLSLNKYYFMKMFDVSGAGWWVWIGGMSLLMECLGDHLCPTNKAVVLVSLPKYYFLENVGGCGIWWVRVRVCLRWSIVSWGTSVQQA